MLDWMTQNGYSNFFMSGSPGTNPRYEYIDWSQGVHYDIKSSTGYPWDVNLFDDTADGFIYQWATENVWGNPSTYKAFDSFTTMPWAPRCVPIGAAGQILSTITLNSAPYHYYDSGCVQRAHEYDLGYVVNEVKDNGNISVGGDIPDNTHTLELSYQYSCDSSYDKCRYKETFEYAQEYGLLRWTYYVLSNGVYVQNSQTVHNIVNSFSNGPLQPVHPCWSW
jgi:hypothetical protein